ncbi:MAG: imidazole glycerol phosphate synthase subunit HisF, partial [Chromatiales bacterium]
AGEMQHFRDAFTIAKVDGALAASVFHSGEINIGVLKQFLAENHISMRL